MSSGNQDTSELSYLNCSIRGASDGHDGLMKPGGSDSRILTPSEVKSNSVLTAERQNLVNRPVGNNNGFRSRNQFLCLKRN